MLTSSGMSLDAMTISLEMGSNAAIKDAVRRGLGASFVSRSTVERELSAGELVSVAYLFTLLALPIRAIGWELGEWWAFIRHGTELDTAYGDPLGDMTLGTLGATLAGLLLAVRRR